MTDIIDDTQIELECGNCGGKTKKNVRWIMDHDKFICECGNLIHVDPGKYRKELTKIESKLDGVQGLMEKFGVK